MQAVGEALAARAAEEEGNAMKALENRTLDSKREMDIMAALDELQTLNKRQARVDTEAALAALHRSAAKDEEDEVCCRQPARLAPACDFCPGSGSQTVHRTHSFAGLARALCMIATSCTCLIPASGRLDTLHSLLLGRWF